MASFAVSHALPLPRQSLCTRVLCCPSAAPPIGVASRGRERCRPARRASPCGAPPRMGTHPPPPPSPGLPPTPATVYIPAPAPPPTVGAIEGEAGDDGTAPPTPPTLHLVSAGVSLPTVTLGAAAVLADADVVLYDDLSTHALPLVRPGATLIPVGKRGGAPSTPQATISALAVTAAKATTVRPPPASSAGHAPTTSRVGVRRAVVVRLKAGDAGVYGRAAEEVGAVVAAGVAVTVLPGVSSVTAAAAAAGVPLTVKGVSDGFTVASGHDPDALDWSGLGRADTLVLLMATRELCWATGGRACGRGRSPRWPGGRRRPHPLPPRAVTAADPKRAGSGGGGLLGARRWWWWGRLRGTPTRAAGGRGCPSDGGDAARWTKGKEMLLTPWTQPYSTCGLLPVQWVSRRR
ncbi:hypothetical protein I4F81_011045 [Pyropia yezoensis]|uniref:Uncharacterized protein n=1 Tax=Pyropia yezoensis TaxID=2788 RepID=A0ACC3CEF5_PYRYE|nr:hypothetical protein I4F81_011045 [Neopyropia yezoensis]